MQQCKCRCGQSSMNFKFLKPGQLGDGWEGECCQSADFPSPAKREEEAQPAKEDPKVEAKQEEKSQEKRSKKNRNKNKKQAEVKESAPQPESQPEQEQQNEEDRGSAGE